MQHSTFWVPASFTHREINTVRKAVAEYDPNLDFGKNDKTGQWCIFLRQGTMEGSKRGDLPVLGFGDIPSPEFAVKRLYDSDALRQGKQMLDDLNKHNDDINLGYEAQTVEAEKELAEAFEWGMRKEGMTPHKKIYIPS